MKDSFQKHVYISQKNKTNSGSQCLRHNLGYKQKIIQFIRRNQVYFSSSNVSTETKCKLFTQHIVLYNDCCISRNVGRTEINLVTSNKLYYFLFITVEVMSENGRKKSSLLAVKLASSSSNKVVL